MWALMKPWVTFVKNLVMISESASTQFSFTISESTRVVATEEATRQLRKQFR
jgi:hypothetical protein